MLPDFYSIKQELLKKVSKRLRMKISEECGFIGSIRKTMCFEGNRTKIIGVDGKVIQDSPFHEASAEFKVPFSEMNQLSPEEVQARLDQMAAEMVSQQKRHFFEAMDKIIDEAGNKVDAEGARFSAELFLRTIETIELDFNPDGSARFPDLIMHPDMQHLAQNELKRLDEDPEISKKLEVILRRKRDEWTARENNRKLVG